MSERKTDKELAFLFDLYIATDWGERFAELIDAQVKLPKRGRVLYVAAGTGSHALALEERAGKDVTLIGVDESAERIALAHAKATVAKLTDVAEFRTAQLEALDFEDEQFELVIGDASLVAPERLPELMAEMTRVAAPGATVALCLPTISSYGEFYSIYWEALMNAELLEHTPIVEQLINNLPTASAIENLAAREGLDEVQSWTNVEEFPFASAMEFFESPLVRDYLSNIWLEPLPAEDAAARERVLAEAALIIDDERQDADFTLSIKATLIVGQKSA